MKLTPEQWNRQLMVEKQIIDEPEAVAHLVVCLEADIERLKGIILQAVEESFDYCPFCDKDIRPRYDCKSCPIDHMGKECLRTGHHADDCIYLELKGKKE